MQNTPNIARIACLLADPARATMLWVLIDGSSRSAGELANHAHISSQSASAHLKKLVEGGMLDVSTRGRHRYFQISNSEVACMIESMATLGEEVFPSNSPSTITRSFSNDFLFARTCYDHLAGQLAVDLFAAMQTKRWLVCQSSQLSLTDIGESALTTLGLDLASTCKERRVLARACTDLTHRKMHLGGSLGAALLRLYVAQGWILRSRQSRTVSITPQGHTAFQEILKL